MVSILLYNLIIRRLLRRQKQWHKQCRGLMISDGVAAMWWYSRHEDVRARNMYYDTANCRESVVCHVMQCPAVPCLVMPCCAMSWPVMPCPALPCRVVLCDALPCLASPCLVLPSHAKPCHATFVAGLTQVQNQACSSLFL